MTRTLLRVAVGVAAAIAAVLPFAGCKPRSTEPAFTGEVKVAVSFPALYSLAANVVGDTGTVKSVKSTQGAHGGEVTAAERRVVESADLLFINGLGLDDEFAKKLRESSSNPNVTVVYLGNLLKHKQLLESDGCACCNHEGEGGHDEDGHAHDPHVWMGIDRAVAMVNTIREKLSERYPAHADAFRRNADAYTARLTALKKEGVDALPADKAGERKMVTAHGSMAYFADTFGIEVVDAIQKTPGKEPSKKELDGLIEKCKKEGVTVIASEPQFSKLGGVKTLAEELARHGLKATIIELDNLEVATEAELRPDWYEEKMRANIAAVKGAFAR